MRRTLWRVLVAVLGCTAAHTLITPTSLPADAAPQGKNGPVVFQSLRDGNWELYAKPLNSTAVVNLTSNPADDRQPAYGPSGKMIAFTSNRTGHDEIFVFNVAKPKELIQVTASGGSSVAASWAPDGTKLVFSSNRDGDYDLYVQQVTGSGQPIGPAKNITNNTADDRYPSWAPDGTRLAWSSNATFSNPEGANPEGDSEVFTVVLGSTGAPVGTPVNVTKNSASDSDPNWSPNSKLLAYESDEDGDYDIYISQADGLLKSKRTQNSVPDASPAWSPDGTMIVFAHKLHSIATINVLSTDPPKIADSADSPQGFPDWSIFPTCTNVIAIKSTKMSATFATVQVQTVYPATGLTVTLTASENAADKHTASAIAKPATTAWSQKVKQLTPGTLYDISVKSPGLCVGTVEAASPEKTKNRKVTLTFKKLYMFDDSDDLSCGDILSMEMKLGDEYEDIIGGQSLYESASICSDEWWNPYDKSMTIANVPEDTIEVGVTAQDDDTWCFIICLLDSDGAWGWGDPPGDGGDDWEAAKKVETKTVATPNDAPAEIDFVLHAFSNQELEYNAYMRLTIAYTD